MTGLSNQVKTLTGESYLLKLKDVTLVQRYCWFMDVVYTRICLFPKNTQKQTLELRLKR